MLAVNRSMRLVIVAVMLLAALVIAHGALSRYSFRELRGANRWVHHSHEVIDALLAVERLTTAAESGQRGYLLTGDPVYLEHYLAASERTSREIERVLDLTRDNLLQQERIPELRRSTLDRLRTLQEGVDHFVAGGQASALDEQRLLRGRQQMDTLRQLIGQMTESERELLADRAARVSAVYRRSRIENVAATGLGVLALWLVASRLLRDLRRREQDTRTITDQAERWRVTLSSIGDAVITTDDRGCVVLLNSEAERLTGWSTAEAAGFPLEQVFRIVNEATRAATESPAARALHEGVVVGLANHTVLLSRDGTETPIDDSAAPIRDADGTITGVVLVFRDVTKAKTAEGELRQLAADLNEADRRKNEFLAMLAHELRNPLAPIRNSVRILQHGSTVSASSPELGILDRQANQLVRLVDDLLDVSRISRGQIELRRAQVDLRQVVLDALDSARVICEDAKQELASELPPEPLWVDGDVTRLTQSIGNLVHNACKYSDPGGRVRVHLAREAGFALLAVRDTGIGIAAPNLSRIFDMFAQVDTSLERARGGLGIGLTLVKQFVELHGGTVEARSDGPGKGSEFVIRLPIVDAPAPAKAAVSPPLAAPEPLAPARKLRVLVVDDNRDAVETLAMLLRVLGHETNIASDGEAALASAPEFGPDVVLLDIGLPRLNGYEVAKRLRELPGGDRIRLIALTGWGQDEDRRRSHEAGFDHHLVKPVEHEELEKILAAVRIRLN